MFFFSYYRESRTHPWLSQAGSICGSGFFQDDDQTVGDVNEVLQLGETREEEEEDDNECDFADDDEWFDLEMMGENGRFEFPVPMEPPVPVEELHVAQFEMGQSFYCDADGYVQVYTQGDGKNMIDRSQKASIGVWFGHDHPMCVLILFVFIFLLPMFIVFL